MSQIESLNEVKEKCKVKLDRSSLRCSLCGGKCSLGNDMFLINLDNNDLIFLLYNMYSICNDWNMFKIDHRK